MDQKALLDHQFTVAAYVLTWVIQIGYLVLLGLKWRGQKREAGRAKTNSHGDFVTVNMSFITRSL